MRGKNDRVTDANMCATIGPRASSWVARGVATCCLETLARNVQINQCTVAGKMVHTAGACRGCGKVFKALGNHLARNDKCRPPMTHIFANTCERHVGCRIARYDAGRSPTDTTRTWDLHHVALLGGSGARVRTRLSPHSWLYCGFGIHRCAVLMRARSRLGYHWLP